MELAVNGESMKKGLMFKDYTLLLLLTIVIIFLVTKAQGSVIEGVKNSAFLTNQNIVGIINIMQSAPNGTVHEVELPKKECTVTIANWTVNVTMKNGNDEYSAITYIINTSKPIIPALLHCKDTERVKIKIRNKENKIYIEE